MAKKGPKKNSKVGKNKAIIRGEKRITATFFAPYYSLIRGEKRITATFFGAAGKNLYGERKA